MRSQPLKISVYPLAGSINKINFYSSYATLLLIFLTSCTPGAGRQIMTGRTALMDGNPKAALPNFAAIAQSNPNYINCAKDLCVGIWTYLGRTYHELGNNQKALESLKKGKGRHWQDRFNKIYLGLVMAQTGQTKEGTAELDAGLKALGGWLSSFAGRGITGEHWDPSGNLQKAIADTRNLLQGDEINWDKVNKAVRWLGVNFEEETSAPRGHID